MTTTAKGKTAAAPAPGERIRAMLPDHTHASRPGLLGLGWSWAWTTPAGSWRIETPAVLIPASVTITFAGGGTTATLPATEVGLRALRGLLLALGAIREVTDAA